MTWVTLSFYCACLICCGATHGITASGAKAVAGVTIACDPAVFPLGTVLHIEGRGQRICQDTGSAIKGNRIDEYVWTHELARHLGKRRVKVMVMPRDDRGQPYRSGWHADGQR